MTWSYNPSLLSQGSAKDLIRLLIGDVISCDPQMQDEEIVALASIRGSVYGAAAECCRSLAAKFSRSVDQSGGTNKILYSQLAKAYTIKANEFELKSTFVSIPYAGGISLSDKQMQDLQNDRVQPEFIKGMTDNTIPVPSVGRTNTDFITGSDWWSASLG